VNHKIDAEFFEPKSSEFILQLSV